MKKIALALAISSVALFAGKDVTPVTTPAVDVPTPAPAKISNNGVALKIGTLGVGLDYEHYFNNKFALRANLNGFKLNKTKTIKGVPFKGKLKLFTAGILADYHPWATSFRVSGGLYYNANKFDVTAKKSGTVTLNGTTYNLGDIVINGKIDFNKVAPYLGIGWSSTESNGWHLTADIGVMYHGKPKVKLNGKVTGGGYSQSQLDQDLKVKENEIRNKIKKYKFYPVISIGIEKKF